MVLIGVHPWKSAVAVLSMNYKTIQLAQNGGVATITLNPIRTGRRPACRRPTRAANHRTGELVDGNIWVGNDLVAALRNDTESINVPATIARVVMPKFKARSRQLIKRIRIMDARSYVFGICDVGATRLRREIDRHFHVCRQWKWRAI